MKTDQKKLLATLPPGACVLHTPWKTDTNDQYIGAISDPLLIPCTYQAEIEQKCPIITDRFISIAGERILRDDKQAVNTNIPAYHNHDLTHGHDTTTATGLTDATAIDANDFGVGVTAPASDHAHDLTLELSTLHIQGETPEENIVHEPLHYEINAYLVDPAMNQKAKVHIGMICFTIDESPDFRYEGWQRMDLEHLGYDAREPDVGYNPRTWNKETLKIVGCIPSKHRKGREFHTHFTPPHNHNGVVGSPNRNILIDSSGRDHLYANTTHKHDVGYVSDVGRIALSLAENLPRHRKLGIWVAKDEDAQIGKGMMVPYVPETEQMLQDLINEGLWAFHADPDEDRYEPVMPVPANSSQDTPGSLHGSNVHIHKFPHHHVVHTTPAIGRATSQHKKEIWVAGHGHRHTHIIVSDDIESGKSINPLRYRRMMLIRRLW